MGAVIVATLMLLVAVPSTAFAAASGSVAGVVVDASNGQPVAGLAVTLTTFTGDGANNETRARSSAAGTFAFYALSADPQTVYEVSATYQNGAYATDTFGLKAGENHRVTLDVYPTTTSAGVVRLDSWTVWVDRDGSALAVQQDIDVTNSSKEGYIGQGRTSDGQNDVLTLPLEPGAGGFQYVGFLGDSRSFVEGDTFHHTATLLPGRSSGTLRYDTASLSRLDLPVTLPTANFELLVPADVTVNAPLLTAGARTQDRGVSYQTYSGTNFKPGDTLRIGLRITAGAGGSRTRTVLGLGGAVVALLLLAVGAGYVRRRSAAVEAVRPVRGSIRRRAGSPTGTSARNPARKPARNPARITTRTAARSGAASRARDTGGVREPRGGHR